MIDKNKFMWGLNPLPEGECLAVWGARAIFLRRELDFLPDRQQAIGSEKARIILGKWIAKTALPRLKKHIRENRWDGATRDVFEFHAGPCSLKASPNGSHGYMYLTATLRGSESVPDGKWSNTYMPKIGGFVMAKVNDIGKCRVLGYFKEDGRVGVIAKPVHPPKWYVRQNGAWAPCELYGAEIAKAAKRHREQGGE
jgi:hypothetical protein